MTMLHAPRTIEEFLAARAAVWNSDLDDDAEERLVDDLEHAFAEHGGALVFAFPAYPPCSHNWSNEKRHLRWDDPSQRARLVQTPLGCWAEGKLPDGQRFYAIDNDPDECLAVLWRFEWECPDDDKDWDQALKRAMGALGRSTATEDELLRELGIFWDEVTAEDVDAAVDSYLVGQGNSHADHDR